MEDADYFIFNDIDMVDNSISDVTREDWNAVRGTGAVVMQIVFPHDMTAQSRRYLFTYHILQCLMFGDPFGHGSCVAAFHLIREALILSGNWTEEILTYLCLQVAGEWGDFKESFCNVVEDNRMWQAEGVLPDMPA
jgi:hypothetical protein